MVDFPWWSWQRLPTLGTAKRLFGHELCAVFRFWLFAIRATQIWMERVKRDCFSLFARMSAHGHNPCKPRRNAEDPQGAESPGQNGPINMH